MFDDGAGDLISLIRSVEAEFATTRLPPLTRAEQAALEAMPGNLAERVYAAAMRAAWRTYLEPVVAELERRNAAELSNLRYTE